MKILIILMLVSSMAMGNEVAIREFINGNNLFTASIYKEVLKENDGNFLVSPFSIETVLALTQSGAKDETGAEIRRGLRLPTTTEKTEWLYATLLPHLKGNEDYILRTANKIYVKNTYPLNESFKKIASGVYQSGIENIDFTQKVAAADTINKWVEKQTEDKIHDLVDPKSLDELTRVILINALYFKGKWVYPFEPFATNKQKFYKGSNEVVEVDMMHNTDIYNYYESPELDAKFLELPYDGNDVSMVVVLPNDKDGLANLENQIERVFSAPKFTQERVSVAFPKFTIENKIQLKEILKKLGINKAFNDEADLSGIAGKKGQLLISDVVQKAFINVTETGTEAAAATSVVLDFQIGVGPSATFKADHAFVFYIRFKGLILFHGRVIHPTHN